MSTVKFLFSIFVFLTLLLNKAMSQIKRTNTWYFSHAGLDLWLSSNGNSRRLQVPVNKWGQLLFKTSNPGKGWDGSNVMAGVYVWVIDYENRVGKSSQMKGRVSLVK